jgi:hypothetical protein
MARAGDLHLPSVSEAAIFPKLSTLLLVSLRKKVSTDS